MEDLGIQEIERAIRAKEEYEKKEWDEIVKF